MGAAKGSSGSTTSWWSYFKSYPVVYLPLWTIGFIWAIIFAILAFDYMRHIAWPGEARNLTQDLSSILVKDQNFTYGPASGFVLQDSIYLKSFKAMLSHTISGGVLMFIAPLQFFTPFRNKYPELHRSLGYVHLFFIFTSQAGAFSYLYNTPADEVFSKYPFKYLLSLLFLATSLTAIFAYYAIYKRDILNHKRLMGMNYALLLSAPNLRGTWFILAQFFPYMDNSVINFGSAQIDGGYTVLLGFVFARLMESRSEIKDKSGKILKPRLSAFPFWLLQIAGLATTIGILYWSATSPIALAGTFENQLHIYDARAGFNDSEFYLQRTWGVFFLLAWILLHIWERRAAYNKDSLGVFEYRVMLTSMALTPIFCLLFYYFYWSSVLSSDTFLAVVSAIHNGWPLTVFFGNVYIHCKLGLFSSRKTVKQA